MSILILLIPASLLLILLGGLLGFGINILIAYILISALCALLFIALNPAIMAPLEKDDHEDWKP